MHLRRWQLRGEVRTGQGSTHEIGVPQTCALLDSLDARSRRPPTGPVLGERGPVSEDGNAPVAESETSIRPLILEKPQTEEETYSHRRGNVPEGTLKFVSNRRLQPLHRIEMVVGRLQRRYDSSLQRRSAFDGSGAD